VVRCINGVIALLELLTPGEVSIGSAWLASAVVIGCSVFAADSDIMAALVLVNL
jgi:hypothetical protein